MENRPRSALATLVAIAPFVATSIGLCVGVFMIETSLPDWAEMVIFISAPILILCIAIPSRMAYERLQQKTEEKVEKIEERSREEPQKVRYAWDLARVKLEAYFDRNLSQINLIFWISVSVMMVGFAFILFSINKSGTDGSEQVSIIGAIAGILTEFIGATFMFIYRSTIQQAKSFMSTLDRINSVGMAVQILDTIPEESTELKSQTKAEIVKILLGHEHQLANSK